MRCVPIPLCALLVPIFLFSGNLPAQTRQDALAALQALQARCEAGTNREYYEAALDEAQAQLGQFFDSPESSKNPGFTDTVERALIAHQTAYVIWKAKLDSRQDYVRSQHATILMMLEVYPDAASLFGRNNQAHARDLITFFWEKAALRIAEAKRMVSGKKR